MYVRRKVGRENEKNGFCFNKQNTEMKVMENNYRPDLV